MPVVEVSCRRLASISGVAPDAIPDSLPFLGLDIEGQKGDSIRIEYSPNRPDYSTEYGVALGLQGIAGAKTGMVNIVMSGGRWRLEAQEGVLKVRPAVTALAARGGRLDDAAIRQIISMQEDLHQGLGRRRRRLAVGIHDMDRLEPPITYTVVGRDFEFVPLGSRESASVRDILSGTDQGARYGGILGDGPVPVIVDSRGTVASMPPVINSAHTTVTESTENLFVDITGMRAEDVERALSVVAVTLQAAGFGLEQVEVVGAGNRTPRLEPREMSLDSAAANHILGLDMAPDDMARCLERARLGADVQGDSLVCSVPAYRFDIFGPMDLVEEVALGYGISNMEPTLPPAASMGRAHHTWTVRGLLDDIMTGLGYTEAVNPGLVGADTMNRCGLAGEPHVEVANSKSRSHTTLRRRILPGLLENLAGNIHEPYPQRMYETGTVFAMSGDGVTEISRLGCVAAHPKASYSEAKSTLQALVYGMVGQDPETPPVRDAMFAPGRTASVVVGGRRAGVVGEISGDVLRAFRIREGTAVAAFEIDIIYAPNGPGKA